MGPCRLCVRYVCGLSRGKRNVAGAGSRENHALLVRHAPATDAKTVARIPLPATKLAGAGSLLRSAFTESRFT